MNPTEYEQYVRVNATWFRGHSPEKREAIIEAENRLKVPFPESLKWLLRQYGYWRATGVAGLPCVVGATLANRNSFPENWVILGQPNSSQKHASSEIVILVLSDEHRWDGKAVFLCDDQGEIVERFVGFTEYTIAKQQELEKKSASQYQRCEPSFHAWQGEPLCWSEDFFDHEEFQRRILETILFHKLQSNKKEDTYQIPNPTLTDQLEGQTADFVADVIRTRKEYLLKNQHAIPIQYHDNSSSPRQNLQHELQQEPRGIEGTLIQIKIEEAYQLAPLSKLGIADSQIVSLVRNMNSDCVCPWVVCWVSDDQLPSLNSRLKFSPDNFNVQFLSSDLFAVADEKSP